MRSQSILDPSIPSTNYGADGNEIDLTDDCFARVTEDPSTGHQRYFVSYCNWGEDKGQMRNPFSQWYEKNREITAIGKMLYSLQEVTKEGFELYLDFLKTGLETARRNAQRVAK